jgi:ankyrin repeat protein
MDDTVEPKKCIVNSLKNSRITGGIIQDWFDTVEVLIRVRDNVNHASKDGRTPIYMSPFSQRMDMVDLLVNNGGDVYVSTSDNRRI